MVCVRCSVCVFLLRFFVHSIYSKEDKEANRQRSNHSTKEKRKEEGRTIPSREG